MAMYPAISLTVERLICAKQERPLFKPLSFNLVNGDILLLHGANGVGKTTCLRTLAGLLTPFRGNIYWQQQPFKAYAHDYLAKMIYLGHHAGIKTALTPSENIQQSLLLAGQAVSKENIAQVLQRVGLPHLAHAPGSHLSAGQQRRVNLARLLLLRVPLWILDEPLTALDPQGMQLVQDILREHQQLGGSVVLSSHHHLAIATATIELEAWEPHVKITALSIITGISSA